VAKREHQDGFATRAIHEGQGADPATGATITPVYQTVTYTQDALGENRGFEYSRTDNPTRRALEEALASLEGGRFGVAYGSGMAAIAGTMQLVHAGDHVVVADDLYGGSYRLFTRVLPHYGVRFSYADATRPEELAKAVEPTTRMVWIETPTNPMLRLVDVAACAEIARRQGALLVVDNTFATPLLQNPLALGAHVCVHSTTKYIGGHSDVIGGAVVVDDEESAETLRFTRNATGGIPGPWDAWLTLRGLKTLSLRMRQHQENAQQVAEFLGTRSEVAAVHYPGLPDHPGHELAARQQAGFGAMISFEIEASTDEIPLFLSALNLFTLAESLGGVESLVAHPASMTHAAMSEEDQAKAGITCQLLRLSVGIEHIEDLQADLDNGFDAVLQNRRNTQRVRNVA